MPTSARKGMLARRIVPFFIIAAALLFWGSSTLSAQEPRFPLYLPEAARVQPTATPEPTPPPPTGRIVFTSIHNGNYDIWKINADGSGRTQLTNDAEKDAWPAWSPNGTRIAFTRRTGADQTTDEIYVMNADGSQRTRLTNNSARDYDPCWAPDGSRIAFVSERDGNAEIYAMGATGANPVRLTNHPGVDREPAWSPDGRKIAFATSRNTGKDWLTEIQVMNADGTGVTRLTVSDDARFREPDWSPDGQRIAYMGGGVYYMNADGTNQTYLSSQTYVGTGSPAWSPDGQWIAYYRYDDVNNQPSPDILLGSVHGRVERRLTGWPDQDFELDWAY